MLFVRLLGSMAVIVSVLPYRVISATGRLLPHLSAESTLLPIAAPSSASAGFGGSICDDKAHKRFTPISPMAITRATVIATASPFFSRVRAIIYGSQPQSADYFCLFYAPMSGGSVFAVFCGF